MSNRRGEHLDVLERRLTGPRRIALFGHRNVGKTTLLAMFYRQASTGRVPGVRLAASDHRSAEYLAEKIAQIEAGESPAGTLAETELHLRLYHGPARLELIVKDYQGEHVALGSDDEPIHAFFNECDAVLLCLDPEGSTHSAERRRRQQEVEHLLERYIAASHDGTTDRPTALLLTKFDRVLTRARDEGRLDRFDDPAEWGVEELVEERYGMTRHALGRHAPRGAIFAVSSFGLGADGIHPPALLEPMGLDGPLLWLAEELEAGDRSRLEWLWELAPRDLPRLSRCLEAYRKRYPRSDHLADFDRRLKKLRRARVFRVVSRAVAACALLAASAAGYDAWGYLAAMRCERDADNTAPSVARRWSDFLAWHPTMSLFWPTRAKIASQKLDSWTIRAAEAQLENGTAGQDLKAKLDALKDRAPSLAGSIARVERAHEQARHDARWSVVRAEALTPPPDGSENALHAPIEAVRGFLREFPDTPKRSEALALLASLRDTAAQQRAALERRVLDDLDRVEKLPNADLAELAERARRFLAEHPQSVWRGEVERRLEGYTQTLDDRDFERAQAFSRESPTNFTGRLERYRNYLRGHAAGGRHVSAAIEAKDAVEAEWDQYDYKLAYDHLALHPNDVAETAKRLRDYLRDHPDGRRDKAARAYLTWWERVSAPAEYRVTLRRGEVDSDVGKYLSGGGPDLSVVVEVGGMRYGPSPIARNTHNPVWDYTFPRPITWKTGDPVAIRIIDNDWSPTPVYTLNSPQGDPLALRLLSGVIAPAKGGATSLVFASDFEIPRLDPPEDRTARGESNLAR